LGVSAFLVIALFSGCRQQMAEQPSYKPLQPSDFFGDRQSARPVVPNTIAWRRLPTEAEAVFQIGGESAADVRRAALLVGVAAGPLALAAVVPGPDVYVTNFPVPVTAEFLQRGQERYTIFCSVCHDAAGTGRGKIVERGYLRPPNYHTDLSRGFERRGIKLPLREAPVGYYFEVITRGYGAMPDYAGQLVPRDRWAIIAYIRALQLSQQARLSDLPPERRGQIKQQLETRRDGANATPR
jgi:mono/diheme cytochrome c family protein